MNITSTCTIFTTNRHVCHFSKQMLDSELNEECIYWFYNDVYGVFFQSGARVADVRSPTGPGKSLSSLNIFGANNL